MKDKIIICGFPGIGKTHYAEQSGCYDSDSSKFSKDQDKWPENYINYIKSIEKGIVLVSTHYEVREALWLNSIPFAVCYPMHRCKEEYLQRYINRNSPKTFIQLLDDNWDAWIDEMKQEHRAAYHMVLGKGYYLSDVLPD